MTAVMKFGHRRLPWSERYALPPRQITMELARTAGIRKHLDQRQKSAMTLLAHYGYGTAMGALFGALEYGLKRDDKTRRDATTGALFGLGVWGSSYMGLLPALGILDPATQHPARRNALMIGAHVIWGVSLAGLFRAIETTLTDEFSDAA
jgi:putative membrane protein